MKNECSIIRDILPLYVENMVSEDTAEFVKEHLESCPVCRAELEKLREPVEVQTEPQPDMDAAPLKRLKKALLMKKVQTILCTAAVLLALMLSVISFLTAPEYFTYSPELVTVTEEANGAVTLSFGNEVTNYKLQQIADPDDRNTVYHLEVWTSVWDRAFHRPGAQAVTAAPESGKPLLVYFTQFINGHAESSSDSSVCIYGTAPDSGGWVAFFGLLAAIQHRPVPDPYRGMVQAAQERKIPPPGGAPAPDPYRIRAGASVCHGLSHCILFGMARLSTDPCNRRSVLLRYAAGIEYFL